MNPEILRTMTEVSLQRKFFTEEDCEELGLVDEDVIIIK